MTHEELLEKLNWLYHQYFNNELKPIDALSAVVELHKPSKGSDELPPCVQCGQIYPCLTIQSIEKVLNG